MKSPLKYTEPLGSKISWKSFKRLIGNRKTKVVKRNGQRWEFVSYNKKTDEVTIIKNKSSRKLHILPREHFISDFTFIGMKDERPLF